MPGTRGSTCRCSSDGLRVVASLEILILIAAAASLLLPGVAALLGFGLFAVVWLWMRRRAGTQPGIALLGGVVLLLLLAESLAETARTDSVRLQNQIETNYRDVWRELDEAAERTAAKLGDLPAPSQDPLRIFQILNGEATPVSGLVPTLLLLDSQGRVFAWGGQGLLHDVGAQSPLAEGRSHLASFASTTLISAQMLPIGSERWQLAAGLSLRIDQFPFAELEKSSPRWTLVAEGEPIDAGALRLSADGGPELIIENPWPYLEERAEGTPSSWRHATWLIWGLVLVATSWLSRRRRQTRAEVEVRSLDFLPGLGAAAGLALMGFGMGTPVWAVVSLAAGGWLATSVGWSSLRGGHVALAVGLGIAAALMVPTLAAILMPDQGLPEMGGQLGSSPADLAIRAALALLVWSLLGSVRFGGKKRGSSSGLLLGVGFTLIVLTATLLDRALPAIVLLVASGICFALWKRLHPSTESLTPVAIIGLAATLVAATGWEVVYRESQKRSVGGALLAAMAPPTATEIQSLADEMQAFLSTTDLDALAPVGIDLLSRQDLAFEIWHHSPLAKYGGLSALRILPRDGGLSSFSFGLPLNRESWVDWASPLWGSAPVPEWEDAVLVGDGELRSEGEPWAYAEYALVLQPGFRLQDQRDEDLAEVLLRAGPSTGEPSVQQLEGASYALYDDRGQAVVSPWPQAPRLPSRLLGGGEAEIETPEGPALAFAARGADGIRVLFLPRLSALDALERVGTHALPTVFLMALLTLVVHLPRVARQGFGETWFHLWHSYSRRLVLVYSVLLLVPLGIVNFLVVRAFEERLVRDQEAAGLLAVESARGVLGEYVLALQPGFGIDAALDHEVLFWLSGVVHHDVNLYWRGSVYASSKAELFTAGLLPRRIPGEIYSGLTLLGHEVSMRTTRAGRAEYLELYAPLTVPGISFDQTRLIVSLPLLAQQEETREQITTLRRRSLLGTAAVVLLIAAAGVRLARRFTTPLTDIVTGTQRIAAGDPSLNLKPAELELATLVEAIDDMAARIHAGRQELLREKSVVERMVDNITAGVVSLDRDRRVMMANRVAGELVGLEVGQKLEEVIASDERLDPLAGFLNSFAPDQPVQRTVVLKDDEDGEQEWSVVWVPLPGEGEPSALLVLEDVTEVLRGQRLEAWAEMARMIAHEIKNPLTPIRLSAEHMQEVHASDPEGFAEVFESCTTNILQQVDELQEIAGEFSTYSRIPKIEPREGDLLATVLGVVDAYRATPQGEGTVRLESDQKTLRASFDPKLLGRAIRNLIENALRAVQSDGQVVVRVARSDGEARIAVADNGPGIREPLLQKIFDPYFSTHDAGTGLGLPIARRIAEEHGGGMTAHNRQSGGLEVVLTLPLDRT